MAKFVNLFLVILGIIAFFWNMFGGIPGIVFIILALTAKNPDQKKKYWKWVRICFGGLALLIIVFILYAILMAVGAATGNSTIILPTPIPT